MVTHLNRRGQVRCGSGRQARDGPRSICPRFRAFKISSRPTKFPPRSQTSPAMTRQFFVGGNFKMNPVSREAKRGLIKTLNDATLDPQTGVHSLSLTSRARPYHAYSTEVVIAPPSLYLLPVLELLRKDVKVSAQNCHTKTSGAFTGEIRCVVLPHSFSLRF